VVPANIHRLNYGAYSDHSDHFIPEIHQHLKANYPESLLFAHCY
jgi:hypothetical protein